MSIPFEPALEKLLTKSATHAGIREVLEWAVLPPGKLFRPYLVEALGADLKVEDKNNLLHLGLALELHHAYSLVHDDMPCMDNDSIRRGKATTHKEFGEWKALLTGDALLAMSYAQLENIQHPHAGFIRKIFHWATGAKGLIQGQWIDLGLEGVNSAGTLLRMHELKTARLMQVASLGVMALHEVPTFKSTKIALRFGMEVGLAFQLLDDLDDLTGAELSYHEKEVNPFLIEPEAMTDKLEKILSNLETHLHERPHTRQFLQAFLRKSALGLLSRSERLYSRLPRVEKRVERLLTSGVFA